MASVDNPTSDGIVELIERRESQLWWLAVLVIVLLALALFVVDFSHASESWLIPQVQLVLNGGLMRFTLVISAMLICAYFRDTARRLRRQNKDLIFNLQNHAKLLEKKNFEVARLKDLSDQLIGMTDVKTSLDLVLGMAVEIVGADTASIMLRELDSDTLKIVASHGLTPEVVESTKVKVGQSISGLVAQDGKPVILNSDELVGEMAERAARGQTIVSSVVIPIHVGDEIRGVVSTAKNRGGACFTEEELEVLSTLVNQASLVIQKADLLDNLKRQVDALASTVKKLRQAQADLMQSEKMASIGQLAGGVAHEINNPLQVILGRTEMLLSRETDETNLRDLHAVLDHTTRISEIVSNLLSFSRQNADEVFCKLDINSVIDKTLNLLEPQISLDDVVIVRELQRDLPSVSGSSGQLQQVFTNIVLNAYQSMLTCGGGTLTVRSASMPDGVKVEFSDTGPGIPQEYLDKLFEPFFTTKAEGEGTGLGLSIAYGIVHSHAGSIEAGNMPKQGACFAVHLPFAQAISSEDIEREEAA